MHQCRFAEQSLQRRYWRLGPHHSAFALKAFQHGGLLATHIRSRAFDDAHIEGPAGTQYVRSEPAVDARDIDRGAQRPDRGRVFRAHIDQPEARTHGGSGDRHTFEQGERVTLHQHAVGEGAAVALIGVTAHIFLIGSSLLHRAPLDPGRESGAAAAAQSRGQDVVGDLLGRCGQGATQAHQTAQAAVFVEVQGVGQAHPGETHPLLTSQPGNLIDQSKPQGMRSALE